MRRVALIILDGWGDREGAEDNAILRARTPCLHELRRSYPSTTLGAAGLDVGLPEGQMGNSEVGHLNLGAGRIVYQELTRINRAIETGGFFENPALEEALLRVKQARGALHLLGLLSDGGVHSHQRHLYALLELARRRGLDRVFVHAFLDGRDTPPRSGAGYVAELERVMGEKGVGRIASVSGRFYAMDRDSRWERVEKAYDAICHARGTFVPSAQDAVLSAYGDGETDEFVAPRVVLAPDGCPPPPVKQGDGFVFFNFRADRARELTRALTELEFDGFDVGNRPQLSAFVTFTPYDETFDLPVAFPRETLDNIFGEVVSREGLRQLRIAETEKYAHVTFFFNAGREDPFPGEERILVPSPREVATYDCKPEMSAYLVRDRLVAAVRDRRFDVIVANFANMDMVGHTGVVEAAIRAAETVDTCVGDAVAALRDEGWAAVVTADHGNAEEMKDPRTGQAHTAHTINRVPLILVDEDRRGALLREDGILSDVAPTLLALMGRGKPREMTGSSLLGTAPSGP